MVEVTMMNDHRGDGGGHCHCLDIGQHTVQCDGDFGYCVVQLLSVMDSWGLGGITEVSSCCRCWEAGEQVAVGDETLVWPQLPVLMDHLVTCVVEIGLYACMCTSSWIAILKSSHLLCHFLVCLLVLCWFYKAQKERKAVEIQWIMHTIISNNH